ncbi:MAG: ABC transporter permease [Bryobacteraceae bacterium]
MDSLWIDFRYALRGLRRAPLFACVAILSLALGIGANTAIFSLIDQVVLRPLPVKNPDELVIVKSPGPRVGHMSADEDGFVSSWSYPMYKDLRDGSNVFAGLAGHYGFLASMTWNGESRQASGELVTGNYFDLLGVGSALGRVLMASDDVTAGGHPVAVLSYAYWISRLGGDPSVLNQTTLVNGHRMTIVGVAQRGFFGIQVGYQPDVFVPMAMKPQMMPVWNRLDLRNDHWLHLIGRLPPRMTRERAAAGLQPYFASVIRLEAEELNLAGPLRQRYLARTVQLESGARGRGLLRAEAGPMLYALMAMVGLVLLIACGNVANLLLARAAARQKEVAVRLAVGASRGQLIRQLLVESLLLGLLGGVAGLFAASWTLEGMLYLLRGRDGAVLSASLDARELAFHFTLAIAVGLLFGLAPALQGTRPDIAPVLKDAGGSLMGAGGQARLRKVLVAGQIALTLLLLMGAGLFAKSLLRLQSVELGVRASGVAQFSIAPMLSGYQAPQARDFVEGLRAELAGVAGVRAAAFGRIPLFGGSDDTMGVRIEGYTPPDDRGVTFSADYVSTGYFSTMGVPLVAGREFLHSDSEASPKVCVINETAVRKYFEGRDPIGRHLFQGRGATQNTYEIIGIVKDSRRRNVRTEPGPYMFLPNAQVETMGPATFYVRTAQDPASALPSLRAAVRRLNSNVAVYDERTLVDQVSQNLGSDRLLAALTGALGAVAVLLAVLGIYGLLSFLVAMRTREIGLRMALGAGASEVRRLVLGDVGKLVLMGGAVGVPAAYALGKLSESLLYGVAGSDLTIASGALAGILFAALAGAYLPARQATRIDPMTALRKD